MSIKISSVLALCASMAIAAPAIWDGTADVSWYDASAQAYNLTTAEQLAGLAQLVNNGNAFAGKTITLGADIFLNDTTGVGDGSWMNKSHRVWTPIGTQANPFKGEFDALAGKKNRKIYGLYFNDATKSNIGLFGYTNGVKISNIDLLAGRVTANSYVGALIGYAVAGAVTNVHSEVNVAGKDQVGGLVGIYNKGLEACISKLSVQANVTGRSYVGGLIGYSYVSVIGSAEDNIFFIGNVTGTQGLGYVGGIVGYGASVSHAYVEGSVKGAGFVGGIVGYATGKIDSVYHIGGDVSSDGGYVGGIAGYAKGSITSAHSEGTVTGTGAVGYVGGIVGYGASVSHVYVEGSVKAKARYAGGVVGYATGEIDSVNHIGGDVSNGADYVGGIVGYAIGSVTGSYSEGNVTGVGYVGGLVGFTTGSVMASHSEGNVTGSGDYVGGLIGLSYFYESGSDIMAKTIIVVDGSYSIGNVKGTKYVGGLVGLDSIYQYRPNTYNLERQVKRSYAQGDVKGTLYIGGVLGKSNFGYFNSSSSSYFYSTLDSVSHTNGIVDGISLVGGVAGYTYGSITNSYSKSDVVGTLDTIGGLAGYVMKKIRNSYSEGSVKGYNLVGGLVGYTKDSVTASHSEGNVAGTGSYIGGLVGYGRSIDLSYHKVGNVNGHAYVGGLVGYTAYSVTGSHSEGSVTGIENYVGGLVGYGRLIGSSYHEGGEVKGVSYVGGLAGYTTGSVTDSHSEGDVTGTGGYVGGLAGYTTGSVTGSHSEGDITGTSSYVGGLIGLSYYYYSGSSDITIMTAQNSYAVGNVKGKGCVGGLVGLDSVYRYSNNKNVLVKKISNSHSIGMVIGDDKYVGGVLGKSNYGYRSSSYSSNISLQIHSSYHEGSVVGDSSYVGGVAGYARGNIDSTYHINGAVNGYGYVGGLVGQATSSVKNSYSEGNVLGSKDYVGGVAGSASGKIRNSYAVAKHIRGRNIIGGLAGYVTDSIDVSYFEGDSVTGINRIGGLVGRADKAVDSSYSTANVKGDDEVGGLIGSAYGDVSNSYAIGNVVGDVEHSSVGNDNLGGLVGYQYGGSVSKSMALGNVSGTTKLGGLVGRFDGIKISQSYANGNVTGDYYGDPADEVGNYYIGGLVGYAKGTLEETYASGIVKGIEDEPVYTGCIVGYVNGSLSVSKTYYDKTKCGLGIDGGEETATVSGSPAKTTAEMQIQETFEDWDFAETWKIKEKAYPFLQIYSNSLTNAVVTTVSLKGIKYDGTAKTPLVTSVSLFGETLEYESEYTITYKDNVNAGTATINVCGVKPYGGCKVVNFEIAGIAVEPIIAEIDNMTYTGRALTPEIEVYNGETLLAATDYSVEYKDNVNAGTATVTVTMKGNYSGSASMTFVIEKATPVISRNPTAGDVVLGQTLASSELTGGQANVDGAFVWKTPSTKPTLENEGYAVVFIPTDTDNYTNSADVVISVNVLDMVYVAVHLDDATIDSVLIVKGSNYTLPSAPDVVGSDFMGFYNGKTLVGNTGDVISVDENTVIDAVYKVQTFVITFMNGTTLLQSGEVPYGSVPAAPEVTLPKNTAQYTYSFAGWDKEVVAVTEAATYNAIIDSTINAYEIVFVDFDGDTLKDSTYAYGTLTSAIEKSVAPTRTATAQYTYTFTGWGPSIASVTGDAVYTAQYDSIVNVYEVAFVVPNDTLQSVKMNLAYGAVPAYEGTPTKDATMQYSYTFVGWSPEIESVSGTATYTAVFDSSVRAYTITFVNGSTPLQSDDVAYGTLPEYSGATPIKEATAQYTYTFKSWNPTIVDVTAAATYAAVFDSVVNKYMITFKLGADILQRDSVAYGTLPIAPTVTLPENTAKYTYSVAWNKEVVSVTGSATYTAIIDSILNKYEVVFKDYDGSVLKDSLYAYGTAVEKIVKPANPKRETTAMCTYTFKGWTPEISSVTEDVVYTAEYDSTIRSYTVAFVNGSTKLQSGKLLYGSTPEYNGNMPTKKSNAQYTYTFKGWNPEISSVTGAVTYTAIFDSTLKEYVVTFLNGKTKLQTGNVAYGSMPVYLGDVPTKAPTDSTTYKFVGWEPELATVSGKASYVAKFETVKKTFMVRFMNKFMLDMQVVSYGETPVYTGAVPTKEADEFYSYSFIGWSPEIGPVTRETDYVALFDSTDLSGIADSRLANLEMSVNVVSRNIQISAAPIGSAYAVLDMQGRVLRKGRVESANFNVSMPESGHYLVRVGEKTKRVSIK